MGLSHSHLHELIDPAVKLFGFELVACEIHPESGRTVLRIYIDSPMGITLKDCERVSRQISALLDVEDPVAGKYTLEVSSPGTNRLLITEEHFNRFVGCHIKIKLRQPQNERRNFSGILRSVSEGNVTVVVDGIDFVLSISEIEKANLIQDL